MGGYRPQQWHAEGHQHGRPEGGVEARQDVLCDEVHIARPEALVVSLVVGPTVTVR